MARSLALRLSLVALLGLAVGCRTGRMYIANVPLERIAKVDVSPTGLSAGIRGLDRLESNLYQDAFELELERSLHHSGMFERVVRNDFADSDVDVVIRVDAADLSYRRNVNLAYFPLAVATLTLYIWVGGPIFTDLQYFDVTLHVERPAGHELFAVESRVKDGHWINLYGREYGDDPCRGPGAHVVMEDLIAKLRDGLRSAGPMARRASR